jgi:tetratricopeptide (TPR) repeat protein
VIAERCRRWWAFRRNLMGGLFGHTLSGPPMNRWRHILHELRQQAEPAPTAEDLIEEGDRGNAAEAAPGNGDRERPELAEMECDMGDVEYDAREFASAELHFRKALEYDIDNPRALRGLGSALQEQGKDSEAVYFYLRFLEHDESDASVLQNVGAALHNSGDYQEALRYYVKAAELDPGNSVLEENQGRALSALGETEPAISKLRLAAQLDPHNATAQILLATLLQAEGRLEEALVVFEEFESALEFDPENGDARLDAVFFLEQLGRYAPALAHAEQAAKVFQERDDQAGLARAYWGLGWLYYRIDQLDRAIEVSEKAVELDPSLLGPRFNRALALLLQGRVQEARNGYEEGMGFVSLASDLKSQAIEDLENVLDKRPDLPGGADILRGLQSKYDEMRANRRPLQVPVSPS